MRHDFATAKYNLLYEKVCAYWGLFDNLVVEQDQRIPREHLEAMLMDQAKSGGNAAPASPMIGELVGNDLNEIYELQNAPNACFLNNIKGKAFQYWLETRVAKHFLKEVEFTASKRQLQFEDIEAQWQKAKTHAAAVESNEVDGYTLFFGTMIYTPKIPCSLRKLNEALGGGFDRDGVTMIAGINGSGKTVLASQLTRDFITSGYPTTVVTTEDPPGGMLARMLANETCTNINEFKYKPTTDQQVAGCVAPTVPAWVLNDPRTKDKALALAEACRKVRFLDWTNKDGHSISAYFDNEIDRQIVEGFDPDVIIFDWIGRGIKPGDDFDKVRHLYEAGVNHLVNYARSRRKAIIVLAQFNKTQIVGKKRTTMAMLSECKTMTNRITNFIGISSLCCQEDGEGSSKNLATRQYLNVEKSRNGPGGLVPVDIHFQYQRFCDARTL